MLSTGDSIPRQVAPPRGERGLKLGQKRQHRRRLLVAPPRGERGLKQVAGIDAWWLPRVAPPRGERGLKLSAQLALEGYGVSLPLAGSVD